MSEVRLSYLAKLAGVSALALALTACGNSGSSSTTTSATPSGPAALSGNFVFSITGTDPTDGDYFVLGSFIADGKGGLTSAVADYNLGGGVDPNVLLSGSYSVNGGIATVILTDQNGVHDSFTATLATSGTSSITSFDGTGSGTLYPQTTSGFAPAGTYTFSVKGEGQGVVTGSGGFTAASSGTFTSGNLTYTDALTTATSTTVAGFVYPPETGGRGQASLAGNNLSYYVVAPSQVLMLGLDERALLLFTAQKM